MAEPAVLLISPGILRWTDRDFGMPHLVALGGYLREQTGVRVELIDLNYEPGDHRDLARKLDELGPFLLIGVSAYSSFDYRRVMALGRFLADLYPQVPRVAGGYHASALPTDLVFEGSPYDAVVVGEGERPVAAMVRSLLGGGRIERPIWGQDLEPELDRLPPYAWDLLRRYWPRATQLGRKLQIYLSRGCPYHCTFCMERAKTGYNWRAFSPERALDELSRLARFTDLGQWVVNVADPLFGFRRGWRREVLEGVARRGLLPRQFWTLTRSDDLDDEDVRLLADARFSIGIGLESGSPTMLAIMRKVGRPERYLDAILRLRRLSDARGLSWAVNVIVGHPGETPETMAETRAFLGELFGGGALRGWLSVDPFRLYPGAQVHEQMADWEARFGTRFYHKTWWKSWYDSAFLAEHTDPSASLDFEGRVRFQYDAYPPLLEDIQRRFVGQGRDVDRVLAASLSEQVSLMRPERRDALLARARDTRARAAEPPELRLPVGLNVRDARVRRREEAVRRLLDIGALDDVAVIEALLQVAPERFMDEAEAGALLADALPLPASEGALSAGPNLSVLARGLSALAPQPGERAADLVAGSGYVAALLAELVGPEGRVDLFCPAGQEAKIQHDLQRWPQATVHPSSGVAWLRVAGAWDAVWVGACVPRAPASLSGLLTENGRAFLGIGPRFRPHDLSLLTREGETLREQRLGRARLPVLAGRDGWVPARALAAPASVTLERWPAPALAFHVLAHLDLGKDAANLYDPRLPSRPWVAPLRAAWEAAPGRLSLHALALRPREIGRLLQILADPPAPLADLPGRDLCAAFAAGVQAESARFLAGWQEEIAPATAEALLAPLTHLRDLLWSHQTAPPPRLRVLDCPALGFAGRGTREGGTQVVAISLAAGVEHALQQALHELMHVITDPHVPGEGPRDTRQGSEGFARHAALERVAVAATEAFLRQRAPEHVAGFERWVAMS